MMDTWSDLEEFIHDDDYHEKQLRSTSQVFLIDYYKLYDFNPDIALDVLDNPKHFIGAVFPLVNGKNVQIWNLIESIKIRGIESNHINKLIQVEAIITSTSIPEATITTASYECPVCGETMNIIQEGYEPEPPQKCGGCGNRKGFILRLENCIYEDTQIVILQERPEELPPGEIPEPLECVLKGSLIRSVTPGDRVIIVGVISVKQVKRKSLDFTRIMYANNVTVLNRENNETEFNEEQVKQYVEISKTDNLDNVLIDSFAPHIFGWRHVKQAHLYALFGSPQKGAKDNPIRGDINVLMVGDAGVTKTQLLKFTKILASRAVYTSGKGVTGVGLTASLVKINDRFMLVAGSMPLADKGICLIDEGEKMNEDDMEAIHTPMEDQIVPIDKGDIHMTLNARCATLMACNPKGGHYDVGKPLMENIDFKDTLVSRFDLIFIMVDSSNKETDMKIANAILGLDEEKANPPLDIKTLKNYIQYSKRVKPTIPDDVLIEMRERFNRKRQSDRENKSLSVTWRQLISLKRLCKARARSYLRDTVDVGDLDVVWRLFELYIDETWTDPYTGKVDISGLLGMVEKSVEGQARYIPRVIDMLVEDEMCEMTASGDFMVKQPVLRDKLVEIGKVDASRAMKIIGYALENDILWTPKYGYVSATQSTL